MQFYCCQNNQKSKNDNEGAKEKKKLSIALKKYIAQQQQQMKVVRHKCCWLGWLVGRSVRFGLVGMSVPGVWVHVGRNRIQSSIITSSQPAKCMRGE